MHFQVDDLVFDASALPVEARAPSHGGAPSSHIPWALRSHGHPNKSVHIIERVLATIGIPPPLRSTMIMMDATLALRLCHGLIVQY